MEYCICNLIIVCLQWNNQHKATNSLHDVGRESGSCQKSKNSKGAAANWEHLIQHVHEMNKIQNPF